MPKPGQRSRTLRRVKVRTPGSNTVLRYKKRKPSRAVCATCKKPLAGVARERPAGISKLSKTERRPERPYGGKLCSTCTRKTLVAKARA